MMKGDDEKLKKSDEELSSSWTANQMEIGFYSPSGSSSSWSTEKTTTEEEKENPEVDKDSSQACCLVGWITGIVASLLFIVIVPLGFLLIIYGRNTDSLSILVIGVFLLGLPLLLFAVFLIAFYCQENIEAVKERNEIVEQKIQSSSLRS